MNVRELSTVIVPAMENANKYVIRYRKHQYDTPQEREEIYNNFIMWCDVVNTFVDMIDNYENGIYSATPIYNYDDEIPTHYKRLIIERYSQVNYEKRWLTIFDKTL